MSDFPQKDHPGYRLAAMDADFLLGDSTRGVRFMLEYQKAEDILRAHKIRSTVVVFGSARVPENGTPKQAHWYAEARKFGRLVSERLGPLDPDGDGFLDNVITTGGGPGIMEAANRGAQEAGAPTIGLNITIPHEQVPNPYTTPALTLRFHYFAIRKMHLAMRAAALVVFPGGFGTFDELFEILTLVQTRKMPEVPIVLVDRAYWSSVINLGALADNGMIKPTDIDLMAMVDNADEALAMVTR